MRSRLLGPLPCRSDRRGRFSSDFTFWDATSFSRTRTSIRYHVCPPVLWKVTERTVVRVVSGPVHCESTLSPASSFRVSEQWEVVRAYSTRQDMSVAM